MRNYYALEWGGKGICSDEDGMRFAHYYKFTSKKARDAWVAAGRDDTFNGEWLREPVRTADCELKQVIREGYLYDGEKE